MLRGVFFELNPKNVRLIFPTNSYWYVYAGLLSVLHEKVRSLSLQDQSLTKVHNKKLLFSNFIWLALTMKTQRRIPSAEKSVPIPEVAGVLPYSSSVSCQSSLFFDFYICDFHLNIL